jgi:hypothetical protein
MKKDNKKKERKNQKTKKQKKKRREKKKKKRRGKKRRKNGRDTCLKPSAQGAATYAQPQPSHTTRKSTAFPSLQIHLPFSSLSPPLYSPPHLVRLQLVPASLLDSVTSSRYSFHRLRQVPIYNINN